MNTKTTDIKQIVTGLFLTCIISTLSYAQNVGINATGNAPDASAMLDVDATNKGLLMPRIALTGTTDATTIATPATSLLVYNTATAGSGLTAVTPGYYYNSGTSASPVWKPFSTPSKFTVSFFSKPAYTVNSPYRPIAGAFPLVYNNASYTGVADIQPTINSVQYITDAVATVASNCTFNGMTGWVSSSGGAGNVTFRVYYYRQTNNAAPVTPTLIGNVTVNVTSTSNVYQVSIPAPAVPVNLLPGDMILIYASAGGQNLNFCGSIEFINN